MYDYIRRTYGVDPQVGQRVRHTEIDRYGTVARENKSASHHVQVKMDGQKFASPCHPNALEYHQLNHREAGSSNKQPASNHE